MTVSPEIKRQLSRQASALFAHREFSVLIAALTMFIFLSFSTDTFFTTGNIINLFKQISLLAIIALGSTFIFIAGEIDLSVGALHGLLAMLFASFVINYELNIYLGAIVIIAIGASLSAISGALTTLLRLPSFIVTLGMLSIFTGITLVWSGGLPISGRIDPEFRLLVAGLYFGFLPAQTMWLAIAAAFGAYLLRHTKFGYDLFATGGSRFAADSVGVHANRVKIGAFAFSGALIGLASCILVGWFRGADTQAGTGLELSVIAAVIIGGTGLFGGTGGLLGTLLGALIIGMISNGTVLLGIDSYYEPIAQGTVIIIAITIDIWSRRGSSIG